MFPVQHEELRPDSEPIEGDFREHHLIPSGNVPVPQLWLAVKYFDVATEHRRVGIDCIGEREREEGVVDELERVERDAMLRDECEVGVERIVQESSSEEATRGGDKSRGAPFGFLRGNESAFKNATWRGDFDRRVSVNVDIV